MLAAKYLPCIRPQKREEKILKYFFQIQQVLKCFKEIGIIILITIMTNCSELKDYLYLRCILYAYCFIVFKYMECFLLSNVILLFYLYIVKKI